EDNGSLHGGLPENPLWFAGVPSAFEGLADDSHSACAALACLTETTRPFSGTKGKHDALLPAALDLALGNPPTPDLLAAGDDGLRELVAAHVSIRAEEGGRLDGRLKPGKGQVHKHVYHVFRERHRGGGGGKRTSQGQGLKRLTTPRGRSRT
ncbi:MAG: hypothetical protein BJ554DRAFT_2903, partial [Olpidium bornovanus]